MTRTAADVWRILLAGHRRGRPRNRPLGLAVDTQHIEKSNDKGHGSHQEEKANPPLVGFGAGDRSRRALRFTGLGHRKTFPILRHCSRTEPLPRNSTRLDLDQRTTIDRRGRSLSLSQRKTAAVLINCARNKAASSASIGKTVSAAT